MTQNSKKRTKKNEYTQTCLAYTFAHEVQTECSSFNLWLLSPHQWWIKRVSDLATARNPELEEPTEIKEVPEFEGEKDWSSLILNINFLVLNGTPGILFHMWILHIILDLIHWFTSISIAIVTRKLNFYVLI